MNNPNPKKNTSDKSSPGAILTKASLKKSKEVLLHEKLKESETRYRRLFETAKDGILILDFETGEILDANPFIVKIIGFPLEEILRKRLWEIGLFSNKEESELAFIELKKNGYIRFEDMPIQRRNGQVTEVEFISNVYLENNTKVIQCNVRDITQRIMAEYALIKSEQDLKKQNAEFAVLNKEYSALNEELKESIRLVHQINHDLTIAKEKAEESDKLKTAFLSNMSHEIRTPMNAIIGFSEFLLNPKLTKSKLDEFVQIINASSQQLLSIINDIMDISKIESGLLSVNLELVNIDKLMNELFVTYKKIVDFKKVELIYSTDNPNKLIQVKTDGNRIRQVICNLLNNAIKYTKEGEIQFGYSIRGNFLEFHVTDSGIGIEPENLALIFQRFRQVETTDGTINGGNGLGLSISKALIEKLGGDIKVTSEPGVGSSFVFTIPYSYETDGNKAKTPETIAYNWEDKTILIVEDDVNNHAFIDELISHTHAGILHALNGKQAVDHIKKHPKISLVLMNIKMPEMDGYEAMRLIKQIRPKLAIIAQTAYANVETKQKALDGGFDNYLIKPIDRVLFMQVINSYLSKT